MYLHPDLTPMTHEESVALYRALGEGDVQGRADLYLDFSPLSGRVETEVFRDRLAAVVWLFQTGSDKALKALEAVREERRAPGAPDDDHGGGPADLDDVLAREEGAVETVLALQLGSLELMAVAALEALLGDLLPDSSRARGLKARFEEWSASAGVSDEERRAQWGRISVLADRRNRFAHSLDGSPWAPRGEPVDADRVEDTFQRVGDLALWIDHAVSAETVGRKSTRTKERP
ncbi:MAG: hypothetical protein WA971_05095 [Microbacterium sp.]